MGRTNGRSRNVIVFVFVYGQIPALDVQTREAGHRRRQSRPVVQVQVQGDASHTCRRARLSLHFALALRATERQGVAYACPVGS